MKTTLIQDFDQSIINGKDRVVVFKANPVCRVRYRAGHINNEEKILKANPVLNKYIKRIKRKFAGFMGEVTIDFLMIDTEDGKSAEPQVANISFYIPAYDGKESKFWIAWSTELEYLCWDLGIEKSVPVAEGRMRQSDLEKIDAPVILMHQTKYYLMD